MVTATRVREILQAAAHPQAGIATSGFDVQSRDHGVVIVLFHDVDAIIWADPTKINIHLSHYAATLEAAELNAIRHEHYLLVNDLRVPRATVTSTRSSQSLSNLNTIVTAEIERCISAICDTIGLDALQPRSQYAKLFNELRYPVAPFSKACFSTAKDMVAFIEMLRNAPSLEAATCLWVRSSCIDLLRRARLRSPEPWTYSEMIASIEALDTQQPEY
jgi:hypothetical protein